MHYPVLRAAIVAFVVAILLVLVGWLAARPSRLSSRLGMRGMRRQQTLLRAPLWAAAEPFVRWMGIRMSGVLSATMHARLDAQLTYAGDLWGLSADEYFACSTLSAGLGVILGAVVAAMWNGAPGALSVLVLGGLFALIPYLVIDAARVERFKAIHRGLPYAVDLMALSMSAGLDFPGSIQQVVDKAKANQALRDELSYLLQQLQLGRTRTQALRELVTRVPLESVREFVQALVQAEERGNPVAAVLEIQAATSRARRSNQAEVAANDMRAKMVLPTMMLIAVGLMLIAIPSTMMLDKFTGALK